MCTAQNLELHPRISFQPDENFSAGPTHSMFRAVAAAGALLRVRPNEQLAKSSDGNVLDLSAFGDDIPMRTLAAMCNDSLNPQLVPPEDVVPLPGPLSYGRNVCVLAEGRWITALERDKSQKLYGGMAEFFTANGQPDGPLVAARKNVNEQMTLTFVDTMIGGVRFPAGSLLNLRAKGEAEDVHKKNRALIASGYSVRPLGHIAAASFMRLSAFALPEDQQAEYGVDGLTQGRSMEDLRATAIVRAAKARVRPSHLAATY